MKTVCVIPCLNEEKKIGPVVRACRRYCYKVIVVDDGSRDATAAVARKAGAIVFSHKKNRGLGGATKTGLLAAVKFKPDAYLIIDGDGQHNPKDIPKLMHPVAVGVTDVSIGSRFLWKRTKIPMHRKFGNKVINFLVNLFTGLRLNDPLCGFRVFSSRALRSMNSITPMTERDEGFGFTIEDQFLIAKTELRYKEIAISAHYKGTEHSLHPIPHGLMLMRAVLKFFFKYYLQCLIHRLACRNPKYPANMSFLGLLTLTTNPASSSFFFMSRYP